MTKDVISSLKGKIEEAPKKQIWFNNKVSTVWRTWPYLNSLKLEIIPMCNDYFKSTQELYLWFAGQ